MVDDIVQLDVLHQVAQLVDADDADIIAIYLEVVCGIEVDEVDDDAQKQLVYADDEMEDAGHSVDLMPQHIEADDEVLVEVTELATNDEIDADEYLLLGIQQLVDLI